MDRHVIIVGGGLAGLSAGCYARANGFRTTIVEHNLALGGVCTAWSRGPYVVDGCIQWLTGGAFTRLYEELGIVPAVKLRTLDRWVTWSDPWRGAVIAVTRDLDALARDLAALAPEDAGEVQRLLEVAERVADLMPPGLDRPQELASLREQLEALWAMRGSLDALVRFRKPLGAWAADHLRSETLRRFFVGLFTPEAPTLLLLMVLGYLQRGYLSRPVGGTAAFRNALVRTYQRLGGQWTTHTTVDEILVEDGCACGVRLDDGTLQRADAVISTSSAPETVLRLLGGRYGATELRGRLDRWKTFQPIVLASFGVAAPLSDLPALNLVDGLEPFEVGGRKNDRLSMRVCNDDPSFAPPGHTVVQVLLETEYEFWATAGDCYEAAKDEVAAVALAQLERLIPGVRSLVRMTDVATPLTYFRSARSWRGAHEGWLPNADAVFSHVKKTLPGLESFYMAGQWVEPGGGVPLALLSGRQAVQLLCADRSRAFAVPGLERAA